jgi:ribosome biogenesis protein NSA2
MSRAKVLSNTVKQKRKEKAGKWTVPIPKVKPVSDEEMFKQMRSGKRQKKSWKRMITKVTFVGEGFTRKAPKYERFIRPTGLRLKKAHVTHPELKTTFCLDILGMMNDWFTDLSLSHMKLFRIYRCKKESVIFIIYEFRCDNERYSH